jgi:aspartyl protease family protein
VGRLIFLLLAAVGVLLLVLLLDQKHAPWTDLVGLGNLPVESKILALALIGVVAIALFRQRLSSALLSLAGWALIAAVLLVGYTYRFELRGVADRVLVELIPGRAVSKGRTVEIARAAGGSFAVAAQVNGARIPMVLDTGASAVVLTQEAARAAGLPLEVLNYSVHVETANGRARAAPVTLDRVSVGGITERSVPALIAQPGQLHLSLLGMSFLNRLQSWEVHGDRLVLRGYP